MKLAVKRIHHRIINTPHALRSIGKLIPYCFMFLSFFFFSITADSDPLILKNADENQNRITAGKLISILKGNVHFQYQDASIKSQFARWLRSDGVARFLDGVQVDREGQRLTTNSLEFIRKEKKIYVNGDIDFEDTKQGIRIVAERGIYDLSTKNLILDREPHLFRYDTTANDTLEILARYMAYDDSLKMATARDSVIILKGPLTAFAQKAYYHTDDGIARLRVDPEIYYDKDHLIGDSINLTFIEQRLRGMTVMGNADGLHNEIASNKKDTVITTVQGDSLYMKISTEAKIETTWVYNKVKSNYFRSDTPEKKNNATGKNMILAFNDAGKVHRLHINGNAESIYYVDDESDGSTSFNKASGDKILVEFEEGKAVYLRLTGAVRGKYFSMVSR